MSQEPANKLRSFIGSDLEVDQAIAGMAQPSMTKIFIKREERRTAKRVKEADNFVVIVHSKTPDSTADAFAQPELSFAIAVIEN